MEVGEDKNKTPPTKHLSLANIKNYAEVHNPLREEAQRAPSARGNKGEEGITERPPGHCGINGKTARGLMRKQGQLACITMDK